jgi:hypothetical protein
MRWVSQGLNPSYELAFFGALIFLGPLFLAWLWMLFSGWQEGLADRELR